MIRANLAVVRSKGLGPNTHLCNIGMIVLRRIPTKKKIDDFEANPYKKSCGHLYVQIACFELTLHTPYSGAVVSGGAPLVDPRL